jgi:tripartite-type tricarboxylate transporter receptor subunit TctC
MRYATGVLPITLRAGGLFVPCVLHVLCVLCVLCFLCGLQPVQAQAEDRYPARPIKLIIGFPPGGPTDLLGRLIAQRLADGLEQPVIVENRAGASGALGMEAVARAQPDGYTLAYGASSNVTQLPALRKQLSYHPVRDFSPVSMTATGALTLVASTKVPARTLEEFIAYARAHPGALNFATAGAGSAPHLTAVLFNDQAGIKAVHVPFMGGGPALQATLQGSTDYVFDTSSTSVPLLKSTQVRVLALTSAQGMASLPGVPVATEAGLPGFVVTTWNGILAPKGTSPAVIDRLNRAIRTALAQTDFIGRLAGMGLSPAPMTPEAFGAFIASELARWTDLIDRTGLASD